MWSRLHMFYLLAAAAVFLALQLYFVVTWDSFYAQHPWPGYAAGILPPFFMSSPKSVPIGCAVLFATSFMLTLIPSARGPWLGIAMWAGVMCAVVAIWLATPTMRNDSNLWPVDLVVNGAMTGAPMLIGRTVGLVYWRVRAGQKLELWVVGAAIATLALAAWFYV